jgi:hypothetical protein
MAKVKIGKVVYKGGFLKDIKTPCIIALGIPIDAQIVAPEDSGGKQRTNKAITLAISSIRNNRITDKYVMEKAIGRSAVPMYREHRYGYRYKVGSLQKPTKAFDPDPEITCASGIHFFATIDLALEYLATNRGYSLGWPLRILGAGIENRELFTGFVNSQVQRYNNDRTILRGYNGLKVKLAKCLRKRISPKLTLV